MIYREYKPSKQLAPYVECYWSALADSPPFRERESLIPDGTIELMFNFGDNYSQILDDTAHIIKGSHVIGIRKQSLVISQTNRQNFFCVRFKLGGTYPFFKIPVHLFSNGFHTLQDLFGNEFRILEEQLANIPSNEKRVEYIENYLLKKMLDIPRDYSFVKNCYRELLRSPSVYDLSRRLKSNYKTLERKFLSIYGLTPREIMKISRFNKAVLSMYSCRYSSLTGVAYDCGYYDQSHFIREFRQLTGFTPGEFLKEQFTIVQVIQPALADRLSKSYNLE